MESLEIPEVLGSESRVVPQKDMDTSMLSNDYYGLFW